MSLGERKQIAEQQMGHSSGIHLQYSKIFTILIRIYKNMGAQRD